MAVKLKTLHTVIDGAAETMIVALENERFIGFVAVSGLKDESAWFRDLFVAGTHRHRGIGGRLVKKCLDLAKNAGCESLSALVLNRDLLQFYRPLGFFVSQHEDEGKVIITKQIRK